MNADPERQRLPFEPSKKRQKPAKTSQKLEEEPSKTSQKSADTKNSGKSPKNYKKAGQQPEATKKPDPRRFTKEEMAIPTVVSNRMVRRMAAFCGLPTALGIATLIASYFIVTQKWFNLPNVVVVLVSMGFFGLGVLGLTYGVLSASWDEEIVGSKLGFSEFKTNWVRMVDAWRSTRQT